MLKVTINCIILFLFLAGCSSGPKKADPEQVAEERAHEEVLRNKFNQALAQMDTGDFNRSGREFKDLLKQNPSSELELLIIYNIAGSLEGLKKCEASSKRYREIINKSLGKFKKIESQAIIRLSYMYECLGDDAKLIATLLDARRYKKLLPVAVIAAEVPARLAAAYARQGNSSLAESYFAQAQMGLKTINTNIRNKDKKSETLAKTLYFMGKLDKYKINKETLPAFLTSLGYLQNYLLLSMEMNHPDWSAKSAREILITYDRLYTFMTPAYFGSDVVRAEKKKQAYLRNLESVLLNIDALNKMRLAERVQAEARVVNQFFLQLKSKEKRFRIELSKVTTGTHLTSEARARQGLKLPGKIISNETILERQNFLPKKKSKQ